MKIHYLVLLENNYLEWQLLFFRFEQDNAVNSLFFHESRTFEEKLNFKS